MSESESSPSNTTSTSTSLETNNLNASGNTGVTNVGGGTITSIDRSRTTINNSTTDLGAVEAAVGLSKNALDVVLAANQGTNAFAGKALQTTQDALVGLNSKFVDAVSHFEENSQTTLANTVSSLNQIAKEQSQSANQLVVQASHDSQVLASDTLTTIFKNIGYALATAGAIYVLSKAA